MACIFLLTNDLKSITLSVQNLACISFGERQKADFWRVFNLANNLLF